MYDRVIKKIHGLEKEFDTWWNKKKGGYFISKELQKKYTFFNDPIGKRRKYALIKEFNTYIIRNNLE